MTIEQQVSSQTRCWVKSVIVEYNFCPFAKRELERESIRYSVLHDKGFEACLQAVIDECMFLDSNDSTETTLLIFSNTLSEFDEYLYLVEMAEMLMRQQGYEGVYQLASFHPDYVFAGSESDDAANYTNRSPHPMLHLIREASLEKALQNYPDAESIPERNVEYARSLGVNVLKSKLSDCRHSGNEK